MNLSGGNYFQTSVTEGASSSRVIAATVDETLDNNGGIMARLHRVGSSQFTVRSDSYVDGTHWVATEVGSQVISGKLVQAGKFVASTGGFLSFPVAFSTAPVVLLMVESGNTTWARIINSPANNGFSYAADFPGATLHWIAMEPGDYVSGDQHWYAGAINNAFSGGTFPLGTTFERTPGVLMTIHDFNNSGPVWSRLQNVTNSSFSPIMNSPSTERLNFVAFE